MRKFFLSAWMVSLHLFLCAQQTVQITGKVTDKQTGEPLQGATVTLRNKTFSTITDHEGRFKMQRPTSGSITLVISFVGYEELEVSVPNENNTINAALNADTRLGNEVVVSASRRAEKITNAPASIQVVGKNELEQFAGSNFGELISKVQCTAYKLTLMNNVSNKSAMIQIDALKYLSLNTYCGRIK